MKLQAIDSGDGLKSLHLTCFLFPARSLVLCADYLCLANRNVSLAELNLYWRLEQLFELFIFSFTYLDDG